VTINRRWIFTRPGIGLVPVLSACDADPDRARRNQKYHDRLDISVMSGYCMLIIH